MIRTIRFRFLLSSISLQGFVIYPAQVDIQSKGLTHAGKWTFVRPIFAKLNMCIWQCSPEPFMNPVFLTPSTSLIVRHIEKDLKIWLNPRGMEPVEVQECFALVNYFLHLGDTILIIFRKTRCVLGRLPPLYVERKRASRCIRL